MSPNLSVCTSVRASSCPTTCILQWSIFGTYSLKRYLSRLYGSADVHLQSTGASAAIRVSSHGSSSSRDHSHGRGPRWTHRHAEHTRKTHRAIFVGSPALTTGRMARACSPWTTASESQRVVSPCMTTAARSNALASGTSSRHLTLPLAYELADV
jgi:hypothetical protein